MSKLAAVMTGKGTGAISTIQVFGDEAQILIEKIFKPAKEKSLNLQTGKLILGTISDNGQTIDQVTIGCEGENLFAINCHGNPLIVEKIMELLKKNGAALLSHEQLLAKILSSHRKSNSIEIEAKIFQAKAETIEGTKIIYNQIEGGLSAKAKSWLSDFNLEKIKSESAEILEDSKTAKLIMFGCTIVLAGPANSGKSTLLNLLAGAQKSIVTDIKGTTRDWVSSKCNLGSLIVEIIDTAGLTEEKFEHESIESQAQKKSVEILEKADLVLLVLDGTESAEQISNQLLKNIMNKKILTVINKSDLPLKFEFKQLPSEISNFIQISAKRGTGIDELIKKIQQTLGTSNFNTNCPVCFTARQRRLLEELSQANYKEQAISAIRELLNGQVEV